MKIVIIEDEESAVERLISLLKSLDYDFEVLEVFDSVQTSVAYLKNNKQADLIFMDVHLADGDSFEIIQQVEILTPVIFITAYDEFAIKAFKLNSIDYLLKPLKKQDLQAAVDKFKKLSKPQEKLEIAELLKVFQTPNKGFQKRIVIKLGQAIKVVEIADIAYFFTEDKAEYLCTFDGHKMLMDFHLDEVQGMVDPKVFYRINRQFIVNIKSIEQMFTHSKSRVKLVLNPNYSDEIIVSAERSPDFKQWLIGKE